jgi:uncharacterized protein YbaP (TraB family)
VGRKALWWLLTLGLLSGLNAEAASPVWAIRGAHNTVYLAGSIHLLPANDAVLPPAFDHAYADSALLVMELDLGKFDAMEAMSWMSSHGELPKGTTLRDVLGEMRYTRVNAAAEKLGLMTAGLKTAAPWMVGIELSDAAYMHEGFDPDQGVEEQLVQRALADHKPTAGLETMEEQLGGLVALSMDNQVRMLDQTLDELKDIKSEMRDVVSAWRHGDAAKLATLLSSEYQAFPALYQPLVIERNQRWLPQVEALLKSNDNTMVVVGALHLVGHGGLLEQLRVKGYKVTQLD